ncbi:hypothetical protein M427DRAFT_57311 [Gonapodya prolifera JEL478]|uniref:VWFA domain-containing protein n=1 Tax=Gonapodya prolifera (strain JEL478) TaxID=1344416 RepID=A0A139ACU7_GONPJ|nr:hypothetical protein M427DRAFT_57311 [Gonapodya prolifera JEL478]|eukprot:KXS14646.1 hypothetical protein M427DRAFT_57311 [Gonapodya prolifera JEL478]
MPLEATLIIVDNSEWSRNGDYTPTRMEAQADAVNLLFNAKTQSNPESTVGLMSMAGKSPEVLVTPSTEIGKILTAMHNVKIGGAPRFETAVQIAQLVLKHRQNKNQRQRIVAFVGSPLVEDEKTLQRIAKKLKKNNVAVDVVNFGEESENTAKLEAFVQTVSSGDNSHLVSIPPGPHILSDILISSPIISGEDGVPAGISAGGGGGFEFGVDPSLDPELALALRISLEEERARQEQASGGAKAPEATSTGAGETTAGAATGVVGDDEDLLAQALAMSVGQNQGGDDVNMEDLNEDEEIQAAIRMSLAGEGGTDSSSADADADLLAGVLESLPGVDPNDPRLRDALNKGDKKDGEKK